jgi:hypothetical protein
LQRVREEVFRATRAVYIESLASRPPPTFHESNESSKENKHAKQKKFKTLRCVIIVGGLEKTLRDLQRHTAPHAPTFIIISDFEEHVENRVLKEVKQAQQLVEVEHLVTFSSKPIKRGFFNVKASSFDILIVIPTKFRSKYMMKYWDKNKLRRVVHLPRLPRSGHLLKQKRYKRCFNGSGWDPKRKMRRVSWFKRIVCYSLDSSTIKHVEGIFANLGIHKRWMNLSNY